MQADIAVEADLGQAFPLSRLTGPANCLIFPNLDAANIVYRLLRSLGGLTLVGPILTGIDAPMHILQRGSSVDDIVNIVSVGVVQAGARPAVHRDHADPPQLTAMKVPG